ncbi:unnamed protein product [Mytilus coruscus]|uniref:Uncharacterized protein n=1 Tax=Mytilus coruscus TaxID=42192 RepID=A0A6J8CTZ4_MYTCO|nr:unnamed protein product [Mytilus coruscus]
MQLSAMDFMTTPSDSDFITYLYYLNCTKTETSTINSTITTPFESFETTTSDTLSTISDSFKIFIMATAIFGMVLVISLYAAVYRVCCSRRQPYHDSYTKATLCSAASAWKRKHQMAISYILFDSGGSYTRVSSTTNSANIPGNQRHTYGHFYYKKQQKANAKNMSTETHSQNVSLENIDPFSSDHCTNKGQLGNHGFQDEHQTYNYQNDQMGNTYVYSDTHMQGYYGYDRNIRPIDRYLGEEITNDYSSNSGRFASNLQTHFAPAYHNQTLVGNVSFSFQSCMQSMTQGAVLVGTQYDNQRQYMFSGY